MVIPVGLGFGLINLFIEGRLSAGLAMGALLALIVIASLISAALAEQGTRRYPGRRSSRRRGGHARRSGD